MILSLPLQPRHPPAEHVARARVLVLPPRAGHVHGGAFFRGDDEGVGEGEDCGGGVSVGCREGGCGGEGTLFWGRGWDVPTKPVKAGRKDLGVAGIVCVCVWRGVVIFGGVAELGMLDVRLCFDRFVVDGVVVEG